MKIYGQWLLAPSGPKFLRVGVLVRMGWKERVLEMAILEELHLLVMTCLGYELWSEWLRQSRDMRIGEGGIKKLRV